MTDLRRIALASWACILHTSSVRADVLTEADVLASTQRHFPSIVAAELERVGAEGEQLAAEGAFDPRIRSRSAGMLTGPYEHARTDLFVEQPTSFAGSSWFAGWRLGRGDFPVYDGKLATGPLGEARVGATLPLARNRAIDRRRSSLDRARLAAEVAGAAVTLGRIAFGRTAASRYWDWVLASARVRVARELLRVAEFRQSATDRRVEAGELQASEALENRRGVLQRRAGLAAAERAREFAWNELSLFVRGPDGAMRQGVQWDAPAPPEASPTPAGRSEAIAHAIGHRPELRRLELEAERQQIEARFAANQTAMAADLGGAVGVPIDGDALGYRTPSAEVLLSLEFSPLNRAWRGRQAIALAASARLLTDLSLARDRIAVDVDDALSAWRRADERARFAGDERTTAQELARLERSRFERGDGTLFLVNLREQLAFEAELRELEARTDRQKAFAQYRAAIGRHDP